jgi:BirA family biotin operon repressor/biotin-[acetyl-CoA-carboxylase] ligase
MRQQQDCSGGLIYNAPMHPDLNAAAIAGHRRSTRTGSHAGDDGRNDAGDNAGARTDDIDIEVVDETGSTNADLLLRLGAANGANGANGAAGAAGAFVSGRRPTLLVARRQTAGRGRAGRSWQSDAGSLTFSLAWPFNRPLSGLVGLPLAVGVALADVLRARGIAVGLKWPNDVLLDGGKLAGILIETTGVASTTGTQTWAVIGIGINLAADVATGSATATDTASNPATALPIARLPATERNRLLAELLDALAICLRDVDHDGFAPWVARWNALHAFRDREVRIVDRERELHAGRALGVDDSGRLLLQTAGATVAVMAGDVSLRPVPPSEAR